jgi:hypothetical protein
MDCAVLSAQVNPSGGLALNTWGANVYSSVSSTALAVTSTRKFANAGLRRARSQYLASASISGLGTPWVTSVC